MHAFKPLSHIILVSLLAIACTHALPTLDGMDLTLWKEDRNGCKGHRAKMVEALTKEKEKLKALREMEVVQLLGRPDENDLLERNQKSYVYFLGPGPACTGPSGEPRQLVLRINATGLVKGTLIK